MKVKITDGNIIREFLNKVSIISAFFTIIFIFISIPEEYKKITGLTVASLFIIFYLWLWVFYNKLNHINVTIDGSQVTIKTGDIFKEEDIKIIAFNEYFDTQVDDKIISKRSLNGIYIENHSNKSQQELDQIIDSYEFDDGDLLESNVCRIGKNKRFKLGAICVIDDFALVAFSKFDKHNKAVLTMPEYIEFLINFWDSINKIYSQKNVSVPIFGSGITRIKEHKNISDEELLKIMLWTFRISEMRFKYPAKLNIIIHKDKIDSINLLDIKSVGNGL
ncbi:macro domain-containing protein [Aeromonas sobria]|uniref:macro domain-containing protein n=1 Tax=Aeromonas sobria TaxID=646 RepID=UPI00111971F6|nr:macro domain-containing protein [Aeromonas sobria]TNI89289.1 hypothetical protein CF119_00170 [Aeromonas sobria]